MSLASPERRSLAAAYANIARCHGADSPQAARMGRQFAAARIADVAAWLRRAAADPSLPNVTVAEVREAAATLGVGSEGPLAAAGPAHRTEPGQATAAPAAAVRRQRRRPGCS